MEQSEMLKKLEKYLKSKPKEELIKEFEACRIENDNSPTIKEFLLMQNITEEERKRIEKEI